MNFYKVDEVVLGGGREGEKAKTSAGRSHKCAANNG